MDSLYQKIYLHRNSLKIFFLGLPSGFLSSFVLSTFGLWAKDSHISLGVLGFLTWVSVPYSLKFFISPLTSYIQWGFLGKLMGPQRFWMIFCFLGSICFLLALSFVSFFSHPWLCLCFAFVICILAALWDSIVEPYRVFLTQSSTNAVSSASEVFGYRFGFWFGSVFPLFLSSHYSWSFALQGMSFSLFLFFLIFLLLTKKTDIKTESQPSSFKSLKNYKKYLYDCVSFFYHQERFFPVLKLLIIFKVSDAFCRSMISYSLRDNGYSNLQLAFFEKTFGMGVLILGLSFSQWLTSVLRVERSWPLWISLHGVKSFCFCLSLCFTGELKTFFNGAGLLLLHILSPWGSILFLSVVAVASQQEEGSRPSVEGQTFLEKGKRFFFFWRKNYAHGPKQPSMDNPLLKEEVKILCHQDYEKNQKQQTLKPFSSLHRLPFDVLTVRLAFLHSFASTLRLFVSPLAGFIAHNTSWNVFFATDILFACLGCFFFCSMLHKIQDLPCKNQPKT